MVKINEHIDKINRLKTEYQNARSWQKKKELKKAIFRAEKQLKMARYYVSN